MHDLELVRQAADGNTEARRALAVRLLPVMRARARRAAARGARVDIDDVVQHTWVVLLSDGARQLLQWNPARGATMEGYVGMVTEREVGNERQRQSTVSKHQPLTHDGVLPEVSGACLEQQAVDRDLVRKAAQHLTTRLPPLGARVFTALTFDGLEPAQAAAAAGISRQAVYNWQHQTRQLASAWRAAA
jgi:DNA-directed RNA polymerase specialized sigma24 family protein